jgi:hypothetical protein
MFDPLRESFGERRCTSCKAGVTASKRPSRGLEPAVTRQNAAETQRDGRCARTSLAVGSASYDARRQHVHVRYDITPRRMASSWLATQAERGSCAACTAHSRHLLGWDSDEGRRRLRCSAGAGRLGAALDRDWERGDHRHEQNDDAPGAARLRAAPARSSLHRTFRSAFGAESVRRCGRFQRP